MKKLQLISNKEKFSVKPKDFDGTEFFYKRVTTTSYQAIVKNHIIKGGKIDLNATGLELLEKYVIGWAGVTNEFGEEVEFNPKFCECLPDEIQAELIEAIRGIGGESILEKKKK